MSIIYESKSIENISFENLFKIKFLKLNLKKIKAQTIY
jgi:hypothetical protein